METAEIVILLIAIAAAWKLARWHWEGHLIRKAMAGFVRDESWLRLERALPEWIPEYYRRLTEGLVETCPFASPELARVQQARQQVWRAAEMERAVRVEKVEQIFPLKRVRAPVGGTRVLVLVRFAMSHAISETNGKSLRVTSKRLNAHEELWICLEEPPHGWRVTDIQPRHRALEMLREGFRCED